MKYILFAHYASHSLDDLENLVNRSWLVGETDLLEIGSLYHGDDYYFEDMKIEVIKDGE